MDMYKRIDFPAFNLVSHARAILQSTAVILAMAAFSVQNLEAQTFSVLHYFSGGNDGADPIAGLTIGGAGTFYGTTSGGGGAYKAGVVFQLTQKAASWVLSPLYVFPSQQHDGYGPSAGVVIGPNGHLYGTTQAGGSSFYGTVFELAPPPTVCRSVDCHWNETVLHSFTGPDGSTPGQGNLLFDQTGNMYDTTEWGGANAVGIVYELSPSGGNWTEQILYNFAGTPDGSNRDGANPYGGLISDSAGDLYGTTSRGGLGSCVWICGTVFELSPSAGGWSETILHNFEYGDNGGVVPVSTLLMDPQGNLYGTDGGNDEPEAGVFEVSPAGGGWSYSIINTLGACGGYYGGYYAGLTMDADGNFYGVCASGPPGFQRTQYGFVFKLTFNGIWTLTDLHDFTGSDGAFPTGPVVLDSSGNLFGTASQGGIGACEGSEANGCGVIWEIAGVGVRN